MMVFGLRNPIPAGLVALALLAGPALAGDILIGDLSLMGSMSRVAGDALILDQAGRRYVQEDTLRALGLAPAGNPVIEDGEAWFPAQIERQADGFVLVADPGSLPRQSIALNRVSLAGGTPTIDHDGAYINYRLFGDGTGYRSLTLDSHRYWRSGWQETLVGTLDASRAGGRGFSLLEANWRRDNPARMETEQIGTGVSGAGMWSNPARFAGLQYRRNFFLNPGFVSSPSLRLEGTAALPGVAQLFSGGRNLGAYNIEAGPFDLRNLYLPITGEGAVDVQITDISGATRTLTLRAIGAPLNLAEGVESWSFEAGRFRLGTAMGPWMMSGTFAMGISDQLTLEGRAEYAAGDNGVARYGAGAIYATRYGTLYGGIGIGHGKATETETTTPSCLLCAPTTTQKEKIIPQRIYRAGYTYRRGDWWLDLETKHPSDWRDFGGTEFAKESRTFTIGRQFGNTTVSLAAARFGDTSRNAVTLGHSWNGISIFATADRLGTGERSLFVGLSIPFGGRYSGGASMFSRTRFGDSEGGGTAYASIARNDFTGWRANVFADRDPFAAGGRVDLAYGGYSAEIGGVLGRLGGSDIRQGFIDGAVVIDDGVRFSRRIDDAYLLVDLGQRVAGAEIEINGSRRGITGEDGKAIVPGAFGFLSNQVSVAAEKLPDGLMIGTGSQSVTPFRHAGLRLRFEGERPGFFLRIHGAEAEHVEIENHRFLRIGDAYYVDRLAPDTYRGRAGDCAFQFALPEIGDDMPEIEAVCETPRQTAAR